MSNVLQFTSKRVIESKVARNNLKALCDQLPIDGDHEQLANLLVSLIEAMDKNAFKSAQK